MRRELRTCTLIILGLLAADPRAALAQPTTANDQPFERAADKLQASDPEQAREVGIVLGPGIIVTPTAFTAAGYDSNPDKQFDEEGSPVFLTGVGLNLTAVWDRTLVKFSGEGAWQHFTDDVDRADRLKGYLEGKIIHMLAPGLSLQAGGLFENDEFSFTEDRIAGAFTELGYQDSLFAAFLRGRFTDIQYLESGTVSPDVPEAMKSLYRTDSYDAQRTEAAAGVLVGTRNWFGLYGEGNVADVNYTNQELEDEVDRDADDMYAKTGVRIVFSPVLHGDFGWRWNYRELEDDVVDDFQSSYFDAALTWRPSQFFSLAASVERVIGEPSAAFSRLSDIKSFEIESTYRPLPGLQLSFRAVRQHIREIGDSFEYNSTELDALIAYNYSPRMQLYSEVRYEFFEQDLQDLDYERFRALAGVRVIVDGEDPRLNGDLERLTYYEELRYPGLSEFSFSAGYSWFELPEIRMGNIAYKPFLDEAASRLQEHDGELDGVRFDARIDNAAMHPLGDGKFLNFGFAGFYARYDGSDRTGCEFGEDSNCFYVNILDFNPEQENNTGPFGDLTTETDRTLHYWGVSVDTGFAGLEGGLKDSMPARYVAPWKIGVGVRGLNERTDLHASDPLSPRPVDYDQRIDTHYYGGFIGFEERFTLPDGWVFGVDAQGGLYRAHAEYEGRYDGYVLVGPNEFIREWGSVDADDDDTTVIAGVHLSFGKDLQWGSLEVFGQAEYLGYVPTVALNNDDESGGSPFGIVGTQVGSELSSDDSMNYTVGLKVRF
ncbi:outer membrane beta-barrel protein [Dichotomicrobium thermohalophilum]|nr:outer membrane beta-barrel protein [Dichotomicrobium thermohalophilum]